MSSAAPLIQVARPNDWPSIVKFQQEAMRTGDFRRVGRLDCLCFAVVKGSNPRMISLGSQKTPEGRQAWPGKNWDWLNQGPPIGFMVSSGNIVLPVQPFPMPPDAPDPAWQWSESSPEPKRIPQRIEDRAMKIRGTPFLIIQPVTQIHWVLDLVAPGWRRREIHDVTADNNGLHMAFIYDTEKKTGHLVNGQVV